MAEDVLIAELRAQIQALERKNRLLSEGLRQAERVRGLWDNAVRELQEANYELATLWKVSSAVARTVELEELYSETLQVMIEAIPLKKDSEREIFLVEDGTMKLVARQGGTGKINQEEAEAAEVLFGAAAHGEVVVIPSCPAEHQHPLPHPAPEAHGHVIIPLRTHGRVLGTFYCYTPENADFPPHRIKTFNAIGEQLGIALENALLYEENKKLAMHDPLTGLANRRWMEITAAKALACALRYGRSFSILMLDIDYFKRYNDTHGHLAGDELLTTVGRIISGQIRGADLAVRFGGEEFLVMLPETDLVQAGLVAERIRKAVAEQTAVTVSLGGASLPCPSCSLEALIGMADEALYRAKQNGRNRVEMAEG